MRSVGLKTVTAAAALGFASAAAASDVTSTRAYVGLVWTMERLSVLPDFVAGVRRTSTDPNSDVTGYDVSARFRLAGGFTPDSVRAVYLNGNRSSQAAVGLGYSITHQSPLASIGASAAHFRVGVDFLFVPSRFDAFFDINTLDRPAPGLRVTPAGGGGGGGGGGGLTG